MTNILDCSGALMQMGMMCDCEHARAGRSMPRRCRSRLLAAPSRLPLRSWASISHAGQALPLAGDDDFVRAKMEGREPPETAFKPRLANIAPRAKDSWAPKRSNTQQPPLTGPVSDGEDLCDQGKQHCHPPPPINQPCAHGAAPAPAICCRCRTRTRSPRRCSPAA